MTAGLHRACRLLGLIPSRHGCRRRTSSLPAVWPATDPADCHPDLVPFVSESRIHPYDRDREVSAATTPSAISPMASPDYDTDLERSA